MNNSERDIEDLFNDRFKEDEASVSNRVWDNIKQTLPKESTDTVSFWNLNKRLLFTILALIVVSGVSFFIYDKTITKGTGEETKHRTENTEQEIEKNKKYTIENIEQETQNTEQEIGKNTKDKTIATEQKTEEAIKNQTQNNSITASGLNKRSFVKKKKYSDNYNRFVAEKNKNVATGNNNTITQQSSTKNKGFEEASILSDNAIDNNDVNTVSKNTKTTVVSTDTNNKQSKNKDLTVQRKTNSQKKEGADAREKNTIETKGKQTFNNTKDNITAQTELKKEQKPDENSNSVNTIKPDNEINSSSSYKEDKGKNQLDTLTPSTVTNNLNKVSGNNSTVPSDLFSDSINFSKTTKSETSILSKADSNNQLIPSKEIRTKNADSTLLASTSIVSKKDSIKSDSLQPLPVTDTLSSATKKEKEKKDRHILSKLSFDLLAGPGITGMAVAPNRIDSTSQNRVEHKKNNSANKITLSGGLRINYSLSERLNISVGVFYSNYSQTYTLASRSETYSTTIPDSSLVGSKQDTIGKDTSGHPILGPPHFVYNHFNSVKNSTTEYPGKKVTDHYTFISLPLTASYALINKKIGVVCLGGVTTNILIKGVSHYVNESFTDLVSNNTFTSINMGVTGGIGLSYRFTKHLSFLIEPKVNYFLSNIETASSFIKQKPHSINVNAGLRFKF